MYVGLCMLLIHNSVNKHTFLMLLLATATKIAVLMYWKQEWKQFHIVLYRIGSFYFWNITLCFLQLYLRRFCSSFFSIFYYSLFMHRCNICDKYKSWTYFFDISFLVFLGSNNYVRIFFRNAVHWKLILVQSIMVN